MDSIFSPVMSAGIEVTNVRVGKMTNWDRLTLSITTDGTISPETAFSESAKILIEQYNSLIGEFENKKIEEKEIDQEEENIFEEKEAMADDIEATDKEPVLEVEKKKKRGRPKKTD
jgi:DNA-directed RNA polymerase subunit alpha